MAMGRPCLKILIVCFVVAGLAVGTDADDDIYNDGILHENAVYQPAARETSNDNHPAARKTSNDNQPAARETSNGRQREPLSQRPGKNRPTAGKEINTGNPDLRWG
ncbi:uncharacterized protein LOC119735420 [Patiria miniata]|uniref:Secreted protein n=1 Tax=Patiria miniata TaxID=46514 RepID=A0A914ALZ7_PATMI|nr:uncharacterized protein LOC119735420 [Patiria miniata]